MKNAMFLHGTGGSKNDYYWFADTKSYVEAHDYTVWWPQLPNTDRPQLLETAAYITEHMPELSDDDIIIGHSSACPLILYLLQTVSIKIKQVVLVSGFYQPIDDDGLSELMLPESGFDFVNIKNKANEFVVVNSDNDPWGCNYKQAMPVAKALSATFVLALGQGHMGSTSFEQPYREFPILKDLLAI
jgi:predicted alpha/beta hydrolase family esterase